MEKTEGNTTKRNYPMPCKKRTEKKPPPLDHSLRHLETPEVKTDRTEY